MIWSLTTPHIAQLKKGSQCTSADLGLVSGLPAYNSVSSTCSGLPHVCGRPVMGVGDAQQAVAAKNGKAGGSGCGPQRFAPATPPQLSPVKPRRHGAPAQTRQRQPDVASLSDELTRLLRNSSGAPGARTGADWESLPVNVWDLVWRGHLDLPAQMALCLTNDRHAVLAASAIKTQRKLRPNASADAATSSAGPAGMPSAQCHAAR